MAYVHLHTHLFSNPQPSRRRGKLSRTALSCGLGRTTPNTRQTLTAVLVLPLNVSNAQSVEEVRARHKKEVKALDGAGRKLIKQANKNKKKVAEAEAKIAEVGGRVGLLLDSLLACLSWALFGVLLSRERLLRACCCGKLRSAKQE